MPAPFVLTPFAASALKAGAVLALTIVAARRARHRAFDAEQETALDKVPQGASCDLSRDDDRLRASLTAATTRTVRFGTNGPGLSLDIAALSRIRLQRLPPRPVRVRKPSGHNTR